MSEKYKRWVTLGGLITLCTALVTATAVFVRTTTRLDGRLTAMDERLARIERKMDTRFADTTRIKERLSRLEARVHALDGMAAMGIEDE